ncbi:hypothetical protein NQ284_28055, partial [Escherichia coli]|nr:hypothetical protein [Escherichia coli]MDW4633560.1 hypothetical protein [Escherichia coli]
NGSVKVTRTDLHRCYSPISFTVIRTIQENMLKGGISGRSAKGKRIHTRAIHNIDTDIKLNRALWVMAETLLESLR